MCEITKSLFWDSAWLRNLRHNSPNLTDGTQNTGWQSREKFGHRLCFRDFGVCQARWAAVMGVREFAMVEA